MKSADMSLARERLSAFQFDQVLFTGIDETATFGSVYSFAMHSGLPLSFFGCGPRIPDDLEPATAKRLVEVAMVGPMKAARAAA